jgi:hypothetical protein
MNFIMHSTNAPDFFAKGTATAGHSAWNGVKRVTIVQLKKAALPVGKRPF